MIELEGWVLRQLAAAPGGILSAAPTRDGTASADIEEAIGRLCGRGYVAVEGPPNQNAVLGKDIDRVLLLSMGRQAARRL